MKPRLLDLYCGVGGAGHGYALSGFDVTGVDIAQQPRYAGHLFIQMDAIEFVKEYGRYISNLTMGKFKWKKYSKHKGNLKDYWTNPKRFTDRHRQMIAETIQHLHPEWEPPPDNGKTWVKTICPFHPDTVASAAVNYRANAFNCLGCGVKGDAVKLLIDQKGIRYAEAVKLAAQLSETSGDQIPRRFARKPSRRLFDPQGTSVAVDQRTSQQIHAGVRSHTLDRP